MELKIRDRTVYSSAFDERLGTLVRSVELPESRWGSPWREPPKEFEEKYPNRKYSSLPFSPVPETVDVSITDKCNFGCTYCYQDSRPRRAHGPKDLVETILKGFDEPPYQIAIGGGEPTLHPDFEYILNTAREIGTVPNFTTAGDDSLTDEIINTANKVCGGIAMTFHAFKGIDWFVERYTRLRDKLNIQLNVHVIADKNVATNLRQLIEKHEVLGSLCLVLLAYYPDVGRASMDGLLTKRVYMNDLPLAIRDAKSVNYRIAFSEGLLPYFNSRPAIGVDTTLAMPSEGFFSCYFDPRGRMSSSSFSPPHEATKTVYEEPSQKLWNGLHAWHQLSGDKCYDCKFYNRCSTPHRFHYFVCAFASHNATPPKPLEEEKVEPKSVYHHLRKRGV
jgi:MoaA/NifB/PqqE/SkfB family radical SAM enzyme